MRLFNKHYKSPPTRNPASLVDKAKKEREKIAKAIRRPIKGNEKGAEGETYAIDIKKTKKGYTSQVIMPDGYRSAKLGPFKGKDGLNKAYAYANFLGAAFTGSEDFIKYPEKRSKLEAHIKKGMPKAKNKPKKNPKKGKPLSGEEKFAADLETVWGVPSDSQEAYRVGYYEGVIRGIDTCGVQNYFKRKKLRKNYEKELLEAREEASARVLAGGAGPASYAGRRGGGRAIY